MPPPTRTGYDPVRDIYVTPYAQQRALPPPPPPQVPHATYNNGGGNLSELADAAYHYGGGSNTNDQHTQNMSPPGPPPQAYQPGNPLSAPPGHFQMQEPLHQMNINMTTHMGPGMGVFGPQAMYQSHAHTSPYGPPPPPPQQQQQSPRSAGGPGSRRATRELRPAPPASRALQPQPPAPNQQQYRGYGSYQ
ncbi:uncharacterized protein RCO7_08078 [Rhynchosporium graminicola]|uniref:Uncharacterized protein n=1 Tax=Rhynchosporium graminicola TaxID=2792576 RepID=A0A1E1K759_9HELO|nr:uncharacterized protein RCO7_08078 [Rhynchosporium commune]